MYYLEAAGNDLFEIIKNPEQTEILRIRNGEQIVEFQFLAVFKYSKKIENATYVVVKVPNEESVDIAQIIRLPDGRSAFYVDISDDIKMRVFNDFQDLVSDYESQQEAAATTTTASRVEEHATSRKIMRLPKYSWYAENNMRLEQIPIHKTILKNELTIEEKTLVAFTTYTIVVRNIFITLILTVLLGVAAAICFAGVQDIEGAIIFMALFVGGSFLIKTFSGIFDGFEILKGTQRIKMPIAYRILYQVTVPIAMLWGALAALIFSLIGRNEKFKTLLLPRIAIPKGYGLDDLIYIYKKFEADADKLDEISMQMEEAKQQHEILTQKSNSAIKKANDYISDMKKLDEASPSRDTTNNINALNKKIEELKRKKKTGDDAYKELQKDLQSDFDKTKTEQMNNINNIKRQ